MCSILSFRCGLVLKYKRDTSEKLDNREKKLWYWSDGEVIYWVMVWYSELTVYRSGIFLCCGCFPNVTACTVNSKSDLWKLQLRCLQTTSVYTAYLVIYLMWLGSSLSLPCITFSKLWMVISYKFGTQLLFRAKTSTVEPILKGHLQWKMTVCDR